jgi:hypothetical protein
MLCFLFWLFISNSFRYPILDPKGCSIWWQCIETVLTLNIKWMAPSFFCISNKSADLCENSLPELWLCNMTCWTQFDHLSRTPPTITHYTNDQNVMQSKSITMDFFENIILPFFFFCKNCDTQILVMLNWSTSSVFSSELLNRLVFNDSFLSEDQWMRWHNFNIFGTTKYQTVWIATARVRQPK